MVEKSNSFNLKNQIKDDLYSFMLMHESFLIQKAQPYKHCVMMTLTLLTSENLKVSALRLGAVKNTTKKFCFISYFHEMLKIKSETLKKLWHRCYSFFWSNPNPNKK
jgi:hypothetical protein